MFYCSITAIFAAVANCNARFRLYCLMSPICTNMANRYARGLTTTTTTTENLVNDTYPPMGS